MFARTRTIRSERQSQRLIDNQDSPSCPLRIVSWNISSAQPSQVAPDQASRFQMAPRLIRDEVLSKSPDIIALQESASPTQGIEIFQQYVSVGTRMALHTIEYIDLLIRRDKFSDIEPITMTNLPAVGAILTYHGTKLAVVSIHLPHTKEAAPVRKQLCESIIRNIEHHSVNDMILIGDFNMRKDEDKSVEKMAGELTDAWKEITHMNRLKMFTWNGHENMYHGLYNFKFTARFDRCYVKGDNIRLRDFDLIGNRTVEAKGDYLSDHYGMYVRCDVILSEESRVVRANKLQTITGGTTLNAGKTVKLKSEFCEHRDNDTNNQSDSVESRLNGSSDTTNIVQHHPEELRRLRLQRFQSNMTLNRNRDIETCFEGNSLVDLTDGGDDKKETRTSANKRSTSKRIGRIDKKARIT